MSNQNETAGKAPGVVVLPCEPVGQLPKEETREPISGSHVIMLSGYYAVIQTARGAFEVDLYGLVNRLSDLEAKDVLSRAIVPDRFAALVDAGYDLAILSDEECSGLLSAIETVIDTLGERVYSSVEEQRGELTSFRTAIDQFAMLVEMFEGYAAKSPHSAGPGGVS